jgi:hypothetical protein
MAQDSANLWNSYHAAVNANNMELAKRILRNIQQYKGNPPPPKGGCVKCRQRFY